MINVGGKNVNKQVSELKADTTTSLGLKANQTDLNATNINVSNKTDKSYVDTQIAAVASGSPKGTYATLVALQTAFPTGTTGVYVVTADGKWYYWSGSAWTVGGVYQAATTSVSVAKGKSFTTVDARFEETESDTFYPMTNGNTNGDLSGGTTGWTGIFSTISAASNTLTITGNGGSLDAYGSNVTTIDAATNKKIFVRLKARVTSTGCNKIVSAMYTTPTSSQIFATGTGQITAPVQNQWYDLYFIFTITAALTGKLRTVVYQDYIDAATANGKVMEVQYVSTIDLTTVFGAGNEPSADEMNLMLSKYSNSWFDGTVNLANAKKNMVLLARDLPIMDAGNYFTATRTEGALQELGSFISGANVSPNKTTFMKSNPNLFNTATVTAGNIISAGGSLVVNASYQASDYIPVVTGRTYKSTKAYDYSWFNSAQVSLGGGSPNGSSPTLTAPANASYIRITYANVDASTSMFCQDSLPYEYRAYNAYTIEPTDAEFSKMIQRYSLPSKWANKIWHVIGDSITEHNVKTTKNYQDYIALKIGCTINNYGVSGTGWFTPSTVGGTNQIFNRIAALSATADLITVFAGTNDVASVGKTFVLGTYGDTDQNASFYGALDYTLKQLMAKYPTKTIAVFTPLQRDVADTSFGAVTEANMIAAADAIIKVAGRYSIPVLDLYRFGNMYPSNNTFKTAMMPDGLHPNDNGHTVLADKILSFLNSL